MFPTRIVSLVPSQTELLFDLGLDQEVIGITKFCVHPQEWFRTKTRVGGTKKLHLDIIRRLQPDLIIANKEENVKEQVEELAKEFPVHTTDIANLDDALQLIKNIGAMIGREEKALQIASTIQKEFNELAHQITASIPAAYLIWKDPFMTVGGDTFISDMLTRCGFENVFENESRYPTLSNLKLQTLNFKLLLLSSEPYPFQQKHIDELNFLNKKILLVDGEMFSWYGSRLLHAPAYFQKLREMVYNT